MILLNPFISFPAGGGGGVSDTDAQAYLTATGITDPTISNAINQLCIDLKAASIWTKCLAIYPFPGTTLAIDKYNLKDPQDLDASFRLSESGTVTHSSNGVTGDGSSGLLDTHLNGISHSLNNDSHLSVYVRTNTAAGNKLEIGTFGGATDFWAIKCRDTSDVLFVGSYGFVTDGFISVASNTDAKGFYQESRTSSSACNIYKNGSSVGSTTTTSFTIPSANVGICARGDGASYSDRQIAFASIGTSMNSTEAGDFYTAVQAYQTSLSRQI